MQNFIAERSDLAPEQITPMAQELRRAAADLTRRGKPVRYMGSWWMPGTSRCGCLFLAHTQDDVVEVNRAVGASFDRIVNVLAYEGAEVGEFRSVAEQPHLKHQMREIDARAFPTFILHTENAPLWEEVFGEFPDFQIALYDADPEAQLAHGNMVPFAWNGTYGDLPTTATQLIRRALSDKARNAPPNALGALQAVVNPSHQGSGLSSRILKGMYGLAVERGFTALFAPIRPNRKERYPLTPFERYVEWTRQDGLPIDPWQRVHVRLGATPAGVVPQWMTVDATIDQWELWTNMRFPDSGSYVIQGGLVPLEIDRTTGRGRYEEPHLWMHYRTPPR